jgi:hypothetical protein
MFSIPIKTKLWRRLVVTFAAAAFCSPALAQGRSHVVGHIDWMRFEGDQFHIFGWACEPGHKEPVDLHVYADHAATDKPRGAFVGVGTKANLPAEAGVNNSCHDQADAKHRFAIDLPNEVLAKYKGKKIFIHGLVGGNEDAQLMRSGELTFPDPPFFASFPRPFLSCLANT